jgi:DNA-3-methyladenine glycosylase I
MKTRCNWMTDDPLYLNYHDNEWGIPVYDDEKLFAMLCLEGQQAGLSWITILKKREDFYKIFANFIPEELIKFSDKKIIKILKDPKIIRNRLKVNAIVGNAKAYLELKKTEPSFSDFLWRYVDGKPKENNWSTNNPQPALTKESKAMAKDLKKLGFNFVGPTICYAFMQACGMVNDHQKQCYKHPGNITP